MRVLVLLVCLWAPLVSAQSLLVAVASNFHGTLELLAEEFHQQSGYRVQISPGSTGQHYAQIRNGAPFDLFLSADEMRPLLLEQEGIGVPGSRRTYALGQLVIWSNQPVSGLPFLLQIDRLAIANPRLAPYGEAAMQLLQEFPQADRPQLVMGENVSQTFQFVATGAVPAGLVAMAQVLALPADRRGYMFAVPASAYEEVRQQMLLLQDTPPARAFYQYLLSPAARQIIQQSGYGLPPAEAVTE